MLLLKKELYITQMVENQSASGLMSIPSVLGKTLPNINVSIIQDLQRPPSTTSTENNWQVFNKNTALNNKSDVSQTEEEKKKVNGKHVL